MQLTLDAHIGAFALYIAAGWHYNIQAVEDVIYVLHEFGSYNSYYKCQGKPCASTSEEPRNAADWTNIKELTGSLFMPDWSSVGAGPAMQLAGVVADGLFSWAAWPWGNLNMTTYVDASYDQTLMPAGKAYMMPVSPWFYTNMPGYNKNWLWRGMTCGISVGCKSGIFSPCSLR
ncbi:hypothetical protein AFLA_001697 [Aspergillus flavus NRRL3357]|nr:hypothetical protein AFLA_001697 [Aspergillus flavus NRRL3357]